MLTDYIGGKMKKSLAESVANARYFACLGDGSTDSSVTEQEVVYVLFLGNGVLAVQYVDKESVENANAEGAKKSIEDWFQVLDVTSLKNRLVGINLDGASVNIGKKHGAATLLKESLPWLKVVHCFNHQLKSAVNKDEFQDIKSFQMIDEMLMKIYYLYQNSSKRLRELKVFSNALEEAAPKPSKAHGTCWIDHKFWVMAILLSH